jgi:hypothetical protein
VVLSVASAIQTPAGFHFLVLGIDKTKTRYLALVASLTSILEIPRESAVQCETFEISESTYLARIAAELVAIAIINPLFAGQRLVLHRPSIPVANSIACLASSKGVHLTLTANSADKTPSFSPNVVLQRFSARSDVARLLPSNIACFAGFSSQEDSENELAILSCIPPHCRRENQDSLFSNTGISTGCSPAVLGGLLSQAVQQLDGEASSFTPMSVDLEQVAGGERSSDPLAIINWTSKTPLPTRVSRLELRQLFKEDQTYWLVGLSGALGISLCDWMIERGVRYLVLTSRNPKIDQQWIDDHKANGVTIKVLLWYVLHLSIFIC